VVLEEATRQIDGVSLLLLGITRRAEYENSNDFSHLSVSYTAITPYMHLLNLVFVFFRSFVAGNPSQGLAALLRE
jgi:hypothetical protein